MTNSPLTGVSVTVSLFTYARAESGVGSGTLRMLVNTGSADPRSFGTGLFVLTRESNPDQQLQDDQSGKRVLPASLVGPNEELRDAARRIVKDELGITHRGGLRQTGIFDDVEREGDSRVISIAYWAFVPFEEMAPVLGGRDKVGLELVTSLGTIERFSQERDIEQFDGVSRFGYRFKPSPSRGHQKVLSEQLNGDTLLATDYDDMIFYSWRALRHGFQAELDPFRFLGTQVLPEYFSLTELRELYEACQGEPLSNDQFRRAMQRTDSFIRRSGRTSDPSRQGRGKPASLFTLHDWARPPSL